MNTTPDADDGPRTAELREQLENAIQYPDERVHHIRAALQVLDEDHPNAGAIRADLELAERLITENGDDPNHPDVTNHLRGAYGATVPTPEDVEEGASGGGEPGEGATYVPDGGQVEGPLNGREDALREAFADVPRIENPTDEERQGARYTFPPEVVPDEGPIPDPHHQIRKPVTFDLPLWVLESMAYRFRQADEPPTRFDVESMAFDYAQPRSRFTVGEQSLIEAMRESFGIDVVEDADEA